MHMRAHTFDGNVVLDAVEISHQLNPEFTITPRRKQDRSYAGDLYSNRINSLRNMVNGCRGKVEEEDTREGVTQSQHISTSALGSS